MAVLGLVLRDGRLAVFTLVLVRLAAENQSLHVKTLSDWLTWNLFFELPGRERSLFSPTFRDPSLILCEVDWNGSGAADLDVF